MKDHVSRRKMLGILGLTGLGSSVVPCLDPGRGSKNPGPNHSKSKQTEEMLNREIHSTGEKMPVVGIGTWLQFDVGTNPQEREPRLRVLEILSEKGGRIINSSPMYGRSEEVVGTLVKASGFADSFFYATKVWTQGKDSGINQMNESFRKMRREVMDLMQIHNLVDWQTHIKTLEEWKSRGKVRYIGITHYTNAAHSRLEEIVRSLPIDFAQFNYSINDRHAEKNLLNACLEKGVAVIINQPFEGGALFGRVKNKNLPGWSADYNIRSWAQFFLKFILSHPAVTCVIPGTSNPKHALDNLEAGYGRLPDGEGREKMATYLRSL